MLSCVVQIYLIRPAADSSDYMHVADIRKLAAQLPEGVIHVNHRCIDIRKLVSGRYELDLVVRNVTDNTYQSLTITCDTLVLAATPYSLRMLGIARDIAPALFSIHDRRSTHIYAKSASTNVPDRSDVSQRIYKSVPGSILQEVISGDYGSGIFQAGYACDRFERVWRELQYQGPTFLLSEVQKQLDSIHQVEDLALLENIKIDEVHMEAGFYHRWQIEARVTGKSMDDLMRQAVLPNPARLPRVYLVGEAYSSQQGWTEGALITSNLAVSHILSGETTSISKHAQPMHGPVTGRRDVITYRGLVLNVSTWRARHPGGSGMIYGHGGENIDHLFDMFHAGMPAPLATLFGLQVGVEEHNTP